MSEFTGIYMKTGDTVDLEANNLTSQLKTRNYVTRQSIVHLTKKR